VKFARAKGLRGRRVIGVHILKNILIPIVTVIGLELGSVIAFAIITESIFAWPGTGKLLIDSINLLDRPVIVAYLLVIVTIFIVINFVVDILYSYLDPRVRLGGAAAAHLTMATTPPSRRPLRRGSAVDLAVAPLRRRVRREPTRAARLGMLLVVASSPSRARHLAAESLRPGPARRDGFEARPGEASSRRQALLPGHRRPGPRHALRHLLRPAHLALGRRGEHRHRARHRAGAGLAAAYFGGKVDAVIMRIADIQLSFPAILIALVLLAVLGQGVGKIIARW
jgi:hypothetical protein